MKKTIFTIILGASILMTSCTATTSATRKIDKVEIGMSKDNIRKLFGTPFYKRANETGEQWAYRKSVGDLMQPDFAIFVVTFSNTGTVTAFETMKPFDFDHYYH